MAVNNQMYGERGRITRSEARVSTKFRLPSLGTLRMDSTEYTTPKAL
jgi:hypothetical protein